MSLCQAPIKGVTGTETQECQFLQFCFNVHIQ